jgi:uncharacterized Zn finger protein
VLGDCRACGPSTRATIRAKFNEDETYDEVTVYRTHRIVECRGCGWIYHQIVEANSDLITLMPQ